MQTLRFVRKELPLPYSIDVGHQINLVGAVPAYYDDYRKHYLWDLFMRVTARIRQSLESRWYRYVSTERLILKIRRGKSGPAASALLDSLRERMAFQDGSLEEVDWSLACLDGAVLSSCRLTQANFARASLRGAYFAYSDLRYVDFEHADLFEAHMREANLQSANLNGCDLRSTNLARANLASAGLTNANLSDANLWETNLCGANLKGACLTRCSLRNVITDMATILPDERPCRSTSELQAFTNG